MIVGVLNQNITKKWQHIDQWEIVSNILIQITVCC